MKKILLNGVDGNFGGRAAEILLARYPHEDLIFAAPTEKGLKKYADMGIETRVADFNDYDKLELLTKSATGPPKCDKIEKKRGGGKDATKDTHDNDRGFSASKSLTAETGERVGSIFRL